MVHIGNSIAMIIELLISNYKFKSSDLWNVFQFGEAYIGFTFIYWLCGGCDQYGNPFIYEPLDWGGKPFIAFSFVSSCVIICMIYQTIFKKIQDFKVQIYQNYFIKMKHDINSNLRVDRIVWNNKEMFGKYN